jgi:hypothetical protein
VVCLLVTLVGEATEDAGTVVGSGGRGVSVGTLDEREEAVCGC